VTYINIYIFFILALERVAEECMGRRQWKHYQDKLTCSHLNIEEQQPIAIAGSEDEPSQYNHSSKEISQSNPNHCKTENHRLEQQHNGSQLLEEEDSGG